MKPVNAQIEIIAKQHAEDADTPGVAISRSTNTASLQFGADLEQCVAAVDPFTETPQAFFPMVHFNSNVTLTLARIPTLPSATVSEASPPLT